MKNIIVRYFILLSCVILIVPSTSFAVPLYLTFEGTITNITDTSGIVSTQGYSVGDSVNYVALIDEDVQGSSTLNNGTVLPRTDNATYNWFYVDLLEGDILPPGIPPYYTSDTYRSEHNEGYYTSTLPSTVLFFESQNNPVYISSFGATYTFSEMFADPSLLSLVSYNGYSASYDGDYSSASNFLFNLSLTSISDRNPYETTSPVPEPATVLLLGAGLVGIASASRKKLKL